MTRRTFEDIEVGAVHEVGSFEATESGMRRFAERYDLKPFHVNPDTEAEFTCGGLIASRRYTASCCMRLLVDEFLNDIVSMGSFGMDELRWRAPVRPGDIVEVRMEIVDKTASSSLEDRGYVTTEVTASKGDGEEVLVWRATNIVGRRE